MGAKRATTSGATPGRFHRTKSTLIGGFVGGAANVKRDSLDRRKRKKSILFRLFVFKNFELNKVFITADGHKFEGFVDGDFTQTYNARNLGEDERYYQTDIRLKVLGYLIGAGVNEERPKLTVRENAVDVKIGREQVLLGEIPPYNKNSFYKP